MNESNILDSFNQWRNDWNLFSKDVLKVNLDKEQQEILYSVQVNPRTSVASGTSRGKDFVAAVCGICFLYLTPRWNKKGEMIANTKVAMTAPTFPQINNIMFPEVSRIFNRVGFLPGRLVACDIRTSYKEWFLTGFKSEDTKAESWAGFHAVNTMFIVTESTGVPDLIFDAIEGNLQGNSRFLLVANPNKKTGYFAQSQKSPRFHKFRLNSLNAQNVAEKRIIIPGQVDYDWVQDKVKNWCTKILKKEMLAEENDFEWEDNFYRPNDEFRKKILAVFPKVDEDNLIPEEWILLANERWSSLTLEQRQTIKNTTTLKLGVDVAGMGRDSSVFCDRHDRIVDRFKSIQSGGKANQMEIAGIVLNKLKSGGNAYIDTIGEGAGVYSRLQEQNINSAYSCKYSEKAQNNQGLDLTDITGQFKFANMRAYLFWAVRDWLNPVNEMEVALPEDDELKQEATEIKWWFQSNGKVVIEPKEEIKKRIKRSTDKFDALANTFYPEAVKLVYADAEY